MFTEENHGECQYHHDDIHKPYIKDVFFENSKKFYYYRIINILSSLFSLLFCCLRFSLAIDDDVDDLARLRAKSIRLSQSDHVDNF